MTVRPLHTFAPAHVKCGSGTTVCGKPLMFIWSRPPSLLPPPRDPTKEVGALIHLGFVGKCYIHFDETHTFAPRVAQGTGCEDSAEGYATGFVKWLSPVLHRVALEIKTIVRTPEYTIVTSSLTVTLKVCLRYFARGWIRQTQSRRVDRFIRQDTRSVRIDELRSVSERLDPSFSL